MKNLSIKIFIALLAFIIGVCGSYIFLNFASSKTVSEIKEKSYFVGNRTGEIKVRFLQYLLNQAEHSVIAEFELLNDSEEPIKYQGYNNKNSYCTLVLKRGDFIKEINICSCGVGRGFHTLDFCNVI
jgi:hypothetical protein